MKRIIKTCKFTRPLQFQASFNRLSWGRLCTFPQSSSFVPWGWLSEYMKQCGVTIMIYRYSLQIQGEKQEIDNNPENQQNACLFFVYFFLTQPHSLLMIPIISSAKMYLTKNTPIITSKFCCNYTPFSLSQKDISDM